MTHTDGAMPAFRWPSLRQPVDVLFLVCCVGLTAYVLVPEIFGNGKTKDYSLWFWAGQQILSGDDLYTRMTEGTLDFIYPPPAAILLAIPSWFGKVPLYLTLCVLNSVAWALVGQLSHAMTGSDRIPAPWLMALPGIAMVSFVFDQYDLGQPNLLLLAFVLLGFWCLAHARPWLGGGLFALATAIKVFPIAVLPYLIWRRRWAATASMVLWLMLLLFVIPGPIRGFERNITELKTWATAMVGTSSEKGFGQRETQNWSWINQSIVAVTHRLVRPVNYNQDNADTPEKYMNIASVDYKTANAIVLVVMGLIGLGFIAVLPRRDRMTPRSTADELAILICLMTVASPLARQYYFVWLYFPVTVLIHRAAFDPRQVVRQATWGALLVAAALLTLSLPFYAKVWQAYGNNLVATAILIGALVWHMHHPPALEAVDASGAAT